MYKFTDHLTQEQEELKKTRLELETTPQQLNEERKGKQEKPKERESLRQFRAENVGNDDSLEHQA